MSILRGIFDNFSSKRKASKEPIAIESGEIIATGPQASVLSDASVRSSGGSTQIGDIHKLPDNDIKEIIDVPEDYIEGVTGAAMPAGGLSSTNVATKKNSESVFTSSQPSGSEPKKAILSLEDFKRTTERLEDINKLWSDKLMGSGDEAVNIRKLYDEANEIINDLKNYMFMQLKDNKNNFFEAYKTINDMVNQMNIEKDTLFLMCKNLRKDIEDGYKLVENKHRVASLDKPAVDALKKQLNDIGKELIFEKRKKIQEKTQKGKKIFKTLNDDLLKKMQTENYSQYRDSYKDLLEVRKYADDFMITEKFEISKKFRLAINVESCVEKQSHTKNDIITEMQSRLLIELNKPEYDSEELNSEIPKETIDEINNFYKKHDYTSAALELSTNTPLTFDSLKNYLTANNKILESTFNLGKFAKDRLNLKHKQNVDEFKNIVQELLKTIKEFSGLNDKVPSATIIQLRQYSQEAIRFVTKISGTAFLPNETLSSDQSLVKCIKDLSQLSENMSNLDEDEFGRPNDISFLELQQIIPANQTE